jgi:hypothetical protein
VEHASALGAWESFYVIVGSSAAGLTGLQFVVMALLADVRRKSSEKEISAFGTPTVVHFGAALLVSAVLSAPWPSLHGAAIAVAAIGVGGLSYAITVIVRARRQRKYVMVFEDYVWHIVLPFVAYGAMAFSAYALWRTELVPLFVIGGVSLLLVSIGIHNAWDTVTFLLLDELKVRTDDSIVVEQPASGDTGSVTHRIQ